MVVFQMFLQLQFPNTEVSIHHELLCCYRFVRLRCTLKQFQLITFDIWLIITLSSEGKSLPRTQKAVQQACFQKAVFLEVCKVLTSIHGYGISVDLTALENGIFHSHLKDSSNL